MMANMAPTVSAPRLVFALCIVFSCAMVPVSTFRQYGNQREQSISTNQFENPTCVGSGMNKLMFNQSGYIQFVQFHAKIPSLTGFHTCFWFSPFNYERRAFVFDYGFNEGNVTNLTIEWTGSKSPKWSVRLNGIEFVSEPARFATRQLWHHICISWNGETGEWHIFHDGRLLNSGFNYKSKGVIIPGGGVAVAGQNQMTRVDGMDRGGGIEGFFTLLHFDSRPLVDPRIVKSIYNDCSAKDRGNLIGWIRTPRKGFGGVAEFFGREKCQEF